ncbi:hypothetical protein HOK51_04675 [Candidatus Woesearchaeota archaeon]|jgi:hypothetical protein|nr:hypothetical protein [Candidatus Woesearchaeota archaeon]MBT6519119.1 hypothetical protein [Candidatus Woesearchaeota archaeon]
MKLEDVKRMPLRERRTCRANIRLYPSQMKFIDDHGLSVQLIFDKVLNELGHITPALEDIESIAKLYGPRISRGRGRGGKGNVRRQKISARTRRKY